MWESNGAEMLSEIKSNEGDDDLVIIMIGARVFAGIKWKKVPSRSDAVLGQISSKLFASKWFDKLATVINGILW
jgi:hypothetical protein